jgi:hypothetical protein
MSSAMRYFPGDMNRRVAFVYRPLNLHIIDDSEHTDYSSTALDA